MKLDLLTPALAAALLVPALASAQTTQQTTQQTAQQSTQQAGQPGAATGGNGGSSDQQFLTQAAEANQGEIDAALLAEQRSRNPSVIAFARLMINDHNLMAAKLAQVATVEGVTLQDQASGVAQKQQQSLQAGKSDNFDKNYMQQQIMDHQAVIQQFQTEAANTQKGSMAADLAKLSIPTLQEHLALAQAVQAQLQGGGNQQASK